MVGDSVAALELKAWALTELFDIEKTYSLSKSRR